MKKYIKNLVLAIISFLSVFFVSSCLKVEDDKETEISEINRYVEGKGFKHIGYNIYLKFHNREGVDVLENNVESGNSIILNYEGTYLDGYVWETTDSAKGADLFPDRYFIYGPAQLRSGNITMWGLDTAIKYFSAGDTGTVVIPSWIAWGGGITRVINIGLKEVIKNDSTNEVTKFNNFFTTNSFDVSKELYTGVYWRHPSNPAFELSDTAIYDGEPEMKIKLTGRYAETYYASGIGRQFYPLESVGDSLEMTRTVGNSISYPIVPAIDSALLRMEVGDILEITGGSGIGWGSAGYYHPSTYVTIIPEYMPLHYKIELLEVTE